MISAVSLLYLFSLSLSLTHSLTHSLSHSVTHTLSLSISDLFLFHCSSASLFQHVLLLFSVCLLSAAQLSTQFSTLCCVMFLCQSLSISQSLSFSLPLSLSLLSQFPPPLSKFVTSSCTTALYLCFCLCISHYLFQHSLNLSIISLCMYVYVFSHLSKYLPFETSKKTQEKNKKNPKSLKKTM